MALFDSLKKAAEAVTGASQNRNRKVEVVFPRLPETLGEFSTLPQAAMKTPFDTAALAVLAFCFYPENRELALSMLDLLSGKERWCVTTGNCSLGNAAATAVGKDGTVYVAGTDGPDPVAITQDGIVLWRSDVNNPDVYGPYEITVDNDAILVKYESGMTDGYKLVTLDSNGQLISVRNQKNEQ